MKRHCTRGENIDYSKIYKDLTQAEAVKMKSEFEPLIIKIVNQYTSRMPVEWDQVESMAWEGFCIALRDYDASKSSMTFRQYAGFAIKNAILSGLGNELRTVRMCRYAREKAVERGESLFNSVSIEAKGVGNRINSMYETSTIERGSAYEYLYARLEERFSERDCVIFYKIFGLKVYDIHTNHELAVEYGKSDATISQTVKRMLKWIKEDADIMDVLREVAQDQIVLPSK